MEEKRDIGDLESLGGLEVKFFGQIPRNPQKSPQKWCFFGAKGCITEKGVQSILQLAPHRLVKGAPRNSFCIKSYERAKLGVFLEILSFRVHIGDANVTNWRRNPTATGQDDWMTGNSEIFKCFFLFDFFFDCLILFA